MTIQEAKEILQAFRPGTRDEEDSFFAEALEVMEGNADLRAWFTAQKEFDQGMAQALRSQTLPAGLEESLLTLSARVYRAEPPRFKPRIALLAMAASLAILVGIGVFHLPSAAPHMAVSLTTEKFASEALAIRNAGKIALETTSTDPMVLRVAHLFVVDQSALANASLETRPLMRSENGLAFATWSVGGKSFVLTGDNLTEETIRRLI